MSTETNKTVIKRIFEEGFNQERPAVFDELIGANYVNHDFPTPAQGSEGFKLVAGMFQAAFPDLRVTLETVVAEGDRVATRGYFTGTHRGSFNGVPASGKPINVPYIDIWRIEDGQGVENWVSMDLMGLMQQIGAVPAQS